MKQPFLITTITIFLVAWTISPALAGAGRTGAQILNMGGGTRAEALGGAFVAVSGDVSSLFWNPSGMANVSEIQTTIAYTDYSELFGEASEGIYHALFAGAVPLGEYGVFGTTLKFQGQGTIDVTTDSPTVIRQEDLGTNWVLAICYADKLTDSLHVGITGEIIHQKLTERYVSNAYAVDFGIQYTLNLFPTPITFGTAIQNLGTKIQFKDAEQSDPLPRKCTIGTSVNLIDMEYHKVYILADLTAGIDKLTQNDEDIEAYLEIYPKRTKEDANADHGVGIHAFRWRNLQKSLGVEYWFGNILALRIGYNDIPGIKIDKFNDYFTYGLGVRVRGYQFDLGLTPGGGPNNKRLYTLSVLLRF